MKRRESRAPDVMGELAGRAGLRRDWATEWLTATWAAGLYGACAHADLSGGPADGRDKWERPATRAKNGMARSADGGWRMARRRGCGGWRVWSASACACASCLVCSLQPSSTAQHTPAMAVSPPPPLTLPLPPLSLSLSLAFCLSLPVAATRCHHRRAGAGAKGRLETSQ